jgi:hypothetical protein
VVAAAILAIVVFQVVVRPQPAAGALRDLAATALGQPGPELGSSGYGYTRSIGTIVRTEEGLPQATSWTYTVRVVREVWLATDGSGRVVERYSDPAFASGADEAAWRAAGAVPLDLAPFRSRFDPGELVTQPFGQLPTDPVVLKEAIEQRAVQFHGGGLRGDLGLIAELLGESPASSALRSALLEVAAGLDGLEWNGDVVDELGRSGVSVTSRADGFVLTLVFDPSNSALLSYSTGRIGAQGTAIPLTALDYVERGVVDSVKLRP